MLYKNSHWRKTIYMSSLWCTFYKKWWFEKTHENPYWRDSIHRSICRYCWLITPTSTICNYDLFVSYTFQFFAGTCNYNFSFIFTSDKYFKRVILSLLLNSMKNNWHFFFFFFGFQVSNFSTFKASAQMKNYTLTWQKKNSSWNKSNAVKYLMYIAKENIL